MRIAKLTRQHGFTLVELLIVVIILGILAAIVVPQFASSTDDAQDAAVETNLQNLRSAIQFYRQEHGHWPSAVISTGATCPPGGTAQGGAADSETAFIDALTQFTFANGTACNNTDGTLFGPYLSEIPKNTKVPDAVQRKVNILTAGILIDPVATPGDDSSGWRFDNVTGQLLPNNAP